MRRRDVLLAGGAALALSSPGRAQRGSPRIAVLVANDALLAAIREPLVAALGEFGYVDGAGAVLEFVSGGGSTERLAAHADDLARRRVDVIVAYLTPAVAAAKRATGEIPIVFSAGDPVATGLVASLARPGGNLTGWTASTAESAGKRLQHLVEMIPNLRRVAALLNRTDPFTESFRRQIEVSGRIAGIAVEALTIGFDEVEAGFASLRSDPPGAVIVQPSLPLERAAALALAQRLPTVSEGRRFAAAGGLMAFGAEWTERFPHMARYVDRILKGARPADLPVLQATRYELIVNRGTAAALGLVIPPSILMRADEVIE